MKGKAKFIIPLLVFSVVGLMACAGEASSSSPNVDSSGDVNTTPIDSEPSSPTEDTVESITLSASSASLVIGESTQLTATISPASLSVPISWSSSNSSVASVKDGLVTALSVGEATITASAGDKDASCVITVSKPAATSVTINEENLALTLGDTATLTVTILPVRFADHAVTWSSSDEKVATVDSNGKVTAIEKGTATITAKVDEVTATRTVTVNRIAPTITVDGESSQKILSNAAPTLPTVTAKDCAGQSLECSVVHTLDGEQVDTTYTGGTLEIGALDVGVHTWTFTATDPVDSTLSKTETVSLTVYQKISAWSNDGNFKISDEYSTNPTITSANTDNSVAGLYLPSTSYTYYAEAQFKITNGDASGAGYGFIHTTADPSREDSNPSSWEISGVYSSTSQYKMGKTWSDANYNWLSLSDMASGFDSSGDDYLAICPSSFSGTTIKYAVARVGTLFYSFLNNHLVNVNSYPDFDSTPTAPGLYMKNPSGSGAVVSDFVLTNDSAKVSDKVGTLMSSNNNRFFSPARGDYATYSSYWDFPLWNDETYPYAEYGNCFVFTTGNTNDNGAFSLVRPRVVLVPGSTMEYDLKFLDSNGWWDNGFSFAMNVYPFNTSFADYTNSGKMTNGITLDYQSQSDVRIASVGYSSEDWGDLYGKRDTIWNGTDEWSALGFTRDTIFHIKLEIADSSTFKWTVSNKDDSTKSITATCTASTNTSSMSYMCGFTNVKSSLLIYNFTLS